MYSLYEAKQASDLGMVKYTFKTSPVPTHVSDSATSVVGETMRLGRSYSSSAGRIHTTSCIHNVSHQ